MKGRIKPERRREDLTYEQEDPGTLARPFPGIGSSSLSRESACHSETSLSGFTTPGEWATMCHHQHSSLSPFCCGCGPLGLSGDRTSLLSLEQLSQGKAAMATWSVFKS